VSRLKALSLAVFLIASRLSALDVDTAHPWKYNPDGSASYLAKSLLVNEISRPFPEAMDISLAWHPEKGQLFFVAQKPIAKYGGYPYLFLDMYIVRDPAGAKRTEFYLRPASTRPEWVILVELRTGLSPELVD
jgi:hypothetical protein